MVAMNYGYKLTCSCYERNLAFLRTSQLCGLDCIVDIRMPVGLQSVFPFYRVCHDKNTASQY